MAAGGNAYSIQPDELDGVITDLERCEAALDAMLEDLERDMRSLHSVWEGLSAQAQREAQEEWQLGMRAMRASLAELRSAGRSAHGNYTKVITDNLGLWQGLA
ncbi:MAG: WXG100 family type VII secretion target [Nocardioides sp.]|uniref:WXG100 family type VII secretion target n=1 Tax=Nocardioides sp. TaxID=35761 RepID=UPI003F0806B2